MLYNETAYVHMGSNPAPRATPSGMHAECADFVEAENEAWAIRKL